MVEDMEYPENLFYHENVNKKDPVIVRMEDIKVAIKELEMMMNEMKVEIISLKREILQKY